VQGHRSWVNAVTVEPDVEPDVEPPHPDRAPLDTQSRRHPTRPRRTTHRVATGGADARLLLWEYTEEEGGGDGGAADPTLPVSQPAA